MRQWKLHLLVLTTTFVVFPLLGLAARVTRLDRGDAIVLLFCGSKKSLASGLPMALVLFPPTTVGLIVQISSG